jgi:putative acetyltransferase
VPSTNPSVRSSFADVVVRAYRPSDAAAFRALNEEWIAAHFVLEAQDRDVLSDPERHVLARGGQIRIAELDGEVVGCCAMVPTAPGDYEVAKMAVAPGVRGRGVGRLVLQSVIETARAAGAHRLHLESSDRLPAALRLYESAGFRHLSVDRRPASPYARCNVWMELML